MKIEVRQVAEKTDSGIVVSKDKYEVLYNNDLKYRISNSLLRNK